MGGEWDWLKLEVEGGEMKPGEEERAIELTSDSLKVSRDEVALLGAKILDLEQCVGAAVEEKEEMARKYSALLSEKKEMQKSIVVLTEQRDSLYRVLDMVHMELENKRREVDETNRTREEIAELQRELGRVRDAVDGVKLEKEEMRKGFEEEEKTKLEKLELQFAGLEKKNQQLVSQVMLEKDNMRKGFEKEKAKLEKLELQVAGLERKIEQSEAELGKLRSEREKLSEGNKELEGNVDVLMKERDELQNNTLVEARQERRDDLNRDAPSDPDIIEYPDAEFNDFCKFRGEDCFAANQCWAAYGDGVPRCYALVRKVSSTPFKLRVTWLEPDPDDQEEIDWHDADLPIACGKFKLGAPDTVTDTDSLIFSHQMKFMKTSGQGSGSYLIYPNKGETWAIFRDCDIEWSSNPENHLMDEFEYVEILSDFDQNLGILVADLVKVQGFVSLFQKTKENGVNGYWVQPDELYSFSHRIPSYKMTGNEREGVPRECFELDTAALPTKFFEDGDSSDV